MKKSIVLFFLLSCSFLGFSQNINTAQSQVGFTISNMGGMNTVEGTFQEMSGTVIFNESDLANARFDVCIQAATVNTEMNKRDEHLKKEDFFAVAQYPTICFTSRTIEAQADGFVTQGTLTLKGITKEVAIPFTVVNRTLRGTIEIDRLDYQVGPSGGFMVGKTVNLEIICVLN